MRLLDLGGRSAARDVQAASAVSEQRLYRTHHELLRERGLQTAKRC